MADTYHSNNNNGGDWIRWAVSLTLACVVGSLGFAINQSSRLSALEQKVIDQNDRQNMAAESFQHILDANRRELADVSAKLSAGFLYGRSVGLGSPRVPVYPREDQMSGAK